MTTLPRPARTAKRGRSWRIVAGAFLHFGVLAYLVAVPVACLLTAPKGASAEAILALGLRYSGWFVAGLLAAGIAATLAAAILDAFADRKRQPADPDTHRSEQRLAHARQLAASLPDSQLSARIAALTDRPWRHDDPATQALSRDLVQLIESAAAALASAPPERRGAIEARILPAIGHIGESLNDLALARASQDEAKASAAALYVERRHGPSDFAILPE